MKKYFSEYYRPSDDELASRFKDSVFVFDTSSLLNLYRYTPKTQDDLFKILKRLADQNKIWIPFQVGLEFQKNRLSVISEQKNKMVKLKEVIDGIKNKLKQDVDKLDLKNRHSYIDPDELIADINGAFDRYIASVEESDKEQPDVNDYDKVRSRIDTIIKNSIGKPFTKKELEEIQKEGGERYKRKQPPGYEDETDKKGKVTIYQDLIIKDEFGDLLIWKELINFALNNKDKSIILITDDRKKDWWQIVSGKTIGPRPELLSEIKSISGVSKFYMYNSGRFLDLAKEHYDPDIDNTSIEQVKIISSKKNTSNEGYNFGYTSRSIIEDAMGQSPAIKALIEDEERQRRMMEMALGQGSAFNAFNAFIEDEERRKRMMEMALGQGTIIQKMIDEQD